MKIIKLEEHNENWSISFKNEVTVIESFLSGNLIAAHHIGSTAISGIKAKPIIDILLKVQSISEIDKHNKKFAECGYEEIGEYGIKGRQFFQKRGNEKTHHIHAFKSGNPEYAALETENQEIYLIKNESCKDVQ